MRLRTRLTVLALLLGIAVATIWHLTLRPELDPRYKAKIREIEGTMQQLRAQLPQAKATWQTKQPDHYRMRVHVWRAFNGHEVEAEVLNGKLVNRVCTPDGASQGCQDSPSDTYTVEQLFQRAEQFEEYGKSAIIDLRKGRPEDAFSVEHSTFVQLEFDEKHGYPKAIWYESPPFTFDGFIGYTVEEFEVLPAGGVAPATRGPTPSQTSVGSAAIPFEAGQVRSGAELAEWLDEFGRRLDRSDQHWNEANISNYRLYVAYEYNFYAGTTLVIVRDGKVEQTECASIPRKTFDHCEYGLGRDPFTIDLVFKLAREIQRHVVEVLKVEPNESYVEARFDVSTGLPIYMKYDVLSGYDEEFSLTVLAFEPLSAAIRE